ncbi:MAG: GtrA family protein [Acidobacteriaceae bacterium]|nr:GtrA family protein [Acidobacteriaceae bacterium]
MSRWSKTGVRWLKFNLVGAIGIAVQLATLEALTAGLHLQYLLSTALAVEAAVLHNFFWHEHYTWSDRRHPGWARVLARLLRFNATTGAISIAGNLLLTSVFAGAAHLPLLLANILSIATCSLANFLVSDLLVFQDPRRSGQITS